jgi:hypothetical protein
MQTHKGNIWTDKAKKFTGLDTKTTVTKVDGTDLVLDIDLEITEGQFKLVLVNGDTVILITDTTVDDDFVWTDADLLAGDWKIKIVGNEAKFDLVLKIKEFPTAQFE